MSSYIDLKFINQLSGRLQQFKQKTDYLFNFRCPHCGDSKKSSSTPHLYFTQRMEQQEQDLDDLAWETRRYEDIAKRVIKRLLFQN